MVLNRSAFLSGDFATAFDDIVASKEASGSAHLKVILETGELGTYDQVRRASMLAMAAGADVIKTSTGKIGSAATPPVALCMAEAIRDFREQTGRVVGLKLAGGIRTGQAVLAVPGDRGRDPRPGVAAARPLPPRAPPACSTTCSCSGAGWPPAATSVPTTSRSTEAPPMTDLTQPGEFTLEYASAPESTAIVSLRETYGLFIGGEWVEPRSGNHFPTINPATEEHLATVAEAGADDVDLAVTAARQAWESGWRDLPGRGAGQVPLPHRPAPAGALPGVRRPRDPRRGQAHQGVPRRRPAAGRRPLLPLRGLGRQARLRLRRPAGQAARRRRPDHPVELPDAHGVLEAGPGAGHGQHRRAQAGRDDTADSAPAGRGPAGRRPAAGRGQHRHRRRGDGRGAGRPSGDRQGRLHRLHRGRQAHPDRAGGLGQAPHAGAGRARRPTSSSRTPPWTRPSRASSTASGSTRATSAAPGPACWCRSRCTTWSSTGSPPGWTPCGSVTRWTRTPTSAPSTAGSSWRRSRSWWPPASTRAPRSTSRPVCCPTRASSTPRRSSPACPSPTASPARRSSGRCCPC